MSFKQHQNPKLISNSSRIMASICFLAFDVRIRIYTQGRTTKNKHTRILCDTEFVFNRQISCKRATLLFSMAIVREQRETVFWEHQLFTITATRKDRMLTKKYLHYKAGDTGLAVSLMELNFITI